MGLRNFQIIFDNPLKTYYAGQTVSGKVIFMLDSPKKVRGVIFKIAGVAETRWTVKHGKNSTTHRGDENYFTVKQNILGNHVLETELEPGNHIYYFSSTLPSTLPSSFEGEYGFVRYTVKITLDRPWKFDHVIKAAFTVISNIDLNSNAMLSNPVKVANSKRFGLLCTSDPLLLKVSLPYGGFVPGQKIPFTVEVKNFSSVTVNAVVISLFKIVNYYTTDRKRTKKMKHHVADGIIAIAPVNAGETKVVQQDLVVPVLPPSNLPYCSIIDIEYKLKITCKVSGLHINLSVKVPITIGTIPLLRMQPTSITPSDTSSVAPAVIGWNSTNGTTSGNSSGNYPDLPPPSYEECMFGTNSIADESDSKYTLFANEQRHFAPRYPVYSFPPSAPELP